MSLRDDADLASETLRRCVLFRDVGEAGLALLAGSMRTRRYRRNEIVFHQGDPGDSLYVIVTGSVKIVLPSPEGDEAIIATLRRGDFFGELALLDGAEHSASATALEATQTLVLSRETFLRLVDAERGLRTALLSSLAGELRRLTRHVEELHFLDLAGRLAMRLVNLAADAHPGAVTDVRLAWPFTQSDLAAMIGGTRQSVNRLLNELVDDGVIRLETDELVIPDVGLLRRRAER